MKIGNNSTSINSASLLELETTNKGLVFPRVALTSIASSSPLPSGLLTGTVVYNTNASITNGNGVGLYVWNGTTWISVTPGVFSIAWSLTGNAGTTSANFLGTVDNNGFRLRTNNIERLLIDSLGDFGIGSSNFNALNREKLLIDYGVTTSHTLAGLKGSIDNYFQVNFQNLNNGINASTDYVATADDGTDSTYYVDMGINSSTYSRAAHNWGGAHDGYLYSNSKNLLIGTSTSNDVIFMVNGGAIASNAVLRLKGSTGNVIIGKGDNTVNPSGNIVRGPNANGTDIAGGSLTLQGGSATGTATGGSVNIYGGGTVSGSTGAVNINTNTNSTTNINTGTSTGIVTIGNSLNDINLPKLSASSVVLSDASKNLTSTTPSNNTYLYYNGTNFTWATAASNLAFLTNGAGIASLNYNGSSAASVSLAKGTAAGQVYVTGTAPFTPSLVTMSGDATISSAGSLTLATVNGNIGTFNNITVNAKGLVTGASNVAYTTLTSFSATSPLTYNNTTGVFAINQATTSANGYLSSADWNMFNNKVGSITLNTPSSVFNTPVNFSVSSGAATGTLSLNTQTANTVFAGPVSGVAAAPAFRTLVAADIPSLAGLYIQNQSVQQALSNFNISGNGTIGTNLNVTGTSTLTGLLTSNGGHTNAGAFTTSGGAVNINASSNFATNINTGSSTSNITIGNNSNNILFPKFSTVGSVIYTTAATGQIAGTGSNMSWDDVNNRLGIGVSAPAEKLDVSGNIKFSGALMPNNLPGTSGYYLKSNGAGTAPTWIDMSTIGWALDGNSVSALKNLGTTSNFDLPFITNNTENMRLTTSGYLGVGIAAPEDILHIVENTALSATPESMVTVETRNTNATQGSMPPQLNHVRQIPSAAYSSNTQFLGAIENFAFRVPGSAAFNNFAQWQGSTMNSNGIIGFATRTGMTNGNPATGTLTGGITTATGFTYNMVLNGTVLGVANLLGGATTLSTDANGNIIRTPSDAKLKTNIVRLNDALDKVMKLRGVSYNWIDTSRFGSAREIGFVAQEIEKVVPEVVKNGGEYKSVNYQVLTALLAEAMKDQQKQIEAQKAKTESLQKTLDNQQKMIDLLMQQVKELKEKVK